MLLKYLPRAIPGFPVILKNQTDIFRAEQSGDLSFGMLNEPGQPQLPRKIRYLVSLVGEHLDSSGQQNLLFPLKDKTSYPSSPERLAARQDSWEKLNNALQQLRSMDEQSSALLRYMGSATNSKQEQVADLEVPARIELITLVLHQWNKKISIDTRYLACLDVFARAKKQLLKTMLFPNPAKFAKAKKYMESQVENDPLLYHHAWSMGVALWNGIKKLHAEIAKPQFKEMLANSDWSPAAFLVQHNIAFKRQFRVTARKTNLGGVLSYSVPRGKLVLINSQDGAEDAKELFLGVCSANNFVMDLLTSLIDYACPGLRKLPTEENCPYKETIQRPLYDEPARIPFRPRSLKRDLLKELPKYFHFFPIILTTQEDIFKAEDSGVLTRGLAINSRFQLPWRMRYIKSLFLDHEDDRGNQLLFYSMQARYSWPMTEERKAKGVQIKHILNMALNQIKLLDSSSFLRYMKGELRLEKQARMELISIVLKQHNLNLNANEELLDCMDTLSNIFFHQVKLYLFLYRKKMLAAKKKMEEMVDNDPDLFHNILQVGTTFWHVLKELRKEVKKPAFKTMLSRGQWSPANFIAHHAGVNVRLLRITTSETDLGGVLSYKVPADTLVIYNTLSSAVDANGLFNRACCGGDFMMELLTFLVDYIHPGVRKIPGDKCPYETKIKRS